MICFNVILPSISVFQVAPCFPTKNLYALSILFSTTDHPISILPSVQSTKLLKCQAIRTAEK
jgi:hypothetical protein